jgi:hypothetical protein
MTELLQDFQGRFAHRIGVRALAGFEADYGTQSERKLKSRM